ncbi:MAG: hypothetical protein ACRDY6_09945 [Acidimicrobiia bacterium]
MSDTRVLDAIDLGADWAVKDAAAEEPPPDMSRLTGLERILAEGGSAWRLAVYSSPPRGGLERRVDEAVTTAARETMSASGRAGQYLAQAWNEAYGRDPSPGEAYRHAVRAVEVAAIPVVIPNDGSATLGKVITAMRDAPQKWSATLSPSDGSDPVEVVRGMCELLWRSQWDRHGVPDASVPFDVSSEEAEAAVHLATTLVQWFTGGTVKPR